MKDGNGYVWLYAKSLGGVQRNSPEAAKNILAMPNNGGWTDKIPKKLADKIKEVKPDVTFISE